MFSSVICRRLRFAASSVNLRSCASSSSAFCSSIRAFFRSISILLRAAQCSSSSSASSSHSSFTSSGMMPLFRGSSVTSMQDPATSWVSRVGTVFA
uniref:Uncharacterized protein n=1 Tax=Arundo donax TaxID=35708 RepID=A0A0A9DZE2_ARUDO